LGTKYADVAVETTHARKGKKYTTCRIRTHDENSPPTPLGFRLRLRLRRLGRPLGYRCASLRFAVPRLVMSPIALSKGAIATCRSFIDLCIMYSDLGSIGLVLFLLLQSYAGRVILTSSDKRSLGHSMLKPCICKHISLASTFKPMSLESLFFEITPHGITRG